MRFAIITALLLFARTVFAYNLPDSSGFKEYCQTTLHKKIDSISAEYKRNGRLNSYSCFLNYNQPEAVNYMVQGVNGYQPLLVDTDQRVTTFRQRLTEFNNTSLSTYKVVYINIEAWDVIFKNEVIDDKVIDYTNYRDFLKGNNSDFQEKNSDQFKTVRNTVGSAFGNTPPELLFIIDAKFYYWHTRKPENADIGAQNRNYVTKAGYIGFYPYHYDNAILPQNVKDDQKKIYTIFLDMLGEQWKGTHDRINSDYDWLDPVYTCIFNALTHYKALEGILSLQTPEAIVSHFSANIGSNSSLYKALTLEQRIHVLKVLATQHLFDNEFKLMLNCINNCPEQERRQMLDSIAFAKLYNGNSNLQRSIFLNINGDNLAQYLVATALIANQVFPSYNSEVDAIKDTAFIKLKPGGFLGSAIYNRIDNSTGNILLANLSQAQLIYKHPFKKVLVTITEDYSYGNFTWKRNEYKNVPAILAYALFNHESNQRLWQYLRTAADVGLLFIGGGEIKYFFSRSAWGLLLRDPVIARKVISGFFTMKFASDIVIRDVVSDVLRQSTIGQNLLGYYEKFSMWTDMSYMGIAGLKSIYRSIKTESRQIFSLKTIDGHPNTTVTTLVDDAGNESFRAVSQSEITETNEFLNAVERKIEEKTGFIDDTYLVGAAFTDAYQTVRNKLANLLEGNTTLLQGEELNQLYRDLENQAHRELVAYLKDSPAQEFEKSIKAWRDLGRKPSTSYLQNDVEALKAVVAGSGKAFLLVKLANYENLSKWVDKLDNAADANLISKLDNFAYTNPNKLSDLDDFYKKMKAPAGKKGMIDFTVQINAKNVYYDKTGMPNFVSHSPTINGSKIKYQSQTLNGSSTDMTAANNWALSQYGSDNFRKISGSTKCKIKIDDEWVEHTWHHHQDGRTMFPVPSSLHSAASHSGGASIIEKGLQDFFDSPNL